MALQNPAIAALDRWHLSAMNTVNGAVATQMNPTDR